MVRKEGLPQFLRFQPTNGQAENVVINLLDWQVGLLLIAWDNSHEICFSILLSWPSSTAYKLSIVVCGVV
jgi:hypothetical protein